MKLPSLLAFCLALVTPSHCIAQSPAAPASAPAQVPPSGPVWPPPPTSAEAQLLLIQLQVSLQAYQKVLQLLNDLELDETLARINGEIPDEQWQALMKRKQHLSDRLARLKAGIMSTAEELKSITAGETHQK